MTAITGVHLIGSVPLPDAETVFRTVAHELGPYLARIPDGETGNRHRWIWWQREMLLRHPAMELDPDTQPFELRQWDGALIRTTEWLRFKPGVDPATVTFDTGYAAAALRVLCDVPPPARRGRHSRRPALPGVPADTDGLGLHVCQPHPRSPPIFPLTNAPCSRRCAQSPTAIPHRDLSIQWDVCQEVLLFEDYFPHRPPTYKEDVFAMLARLGDAVPEDVECGYHLCYGSPRDEHLVMPEGHSDPGGAVAGHSRAAATADGLPASAGAAGPLGRCVFRAARGAGAAGRARRCISG